MGDRGSGTLLATLAALAVAGLTAVGVCWAVISAEGYRLQGAADLAAIAGAGEQLTGGDACDAARRSAGLNDATVTRCKVAGDEVEFVVTVHVDAPLRVGPITRTITSHANAGVLTGSQP